MNDPSTELVHTEDCGQVSINISKPGITKGQHWHNSKWELFIVVAGHGLIQERNINTGKMVEFEVSGGKIEAIHMIPGWTHNIINLSDTENLVTVMTCNEVFNPEQPDTFFVPVLRVEGEEQIVFIMRILQVVNDMHRAGLETMLMNYYRNIDRTKIQFDFLTHRPYKSDYDDEILSLGGRMYYAPRLYPQNYIQYFRWMDKFFEEHLEYQIMHSHIDSMSYLPLLAAKRANVPVRIAHSHNTSIDRDLKYPLKQLFRTRITKVANEYCACGEEAGKFLFGNRDFKVIPNAIETERFIYKKEVRKRVRKELHFTDEFVVGHVGRLSYQKNHEFLLEIFAQLYTIYLGARLLLVGIGEKEQELRNKVQKLGLEDVVIFLGNRNDVNELYQAMDVFVMPSFFEGIPVTGIEAQFSGLTCVFSDRVPQEVDFSGNCEFLSLKTDAKSWAQRIWQEYGSNKRSEKSRSVQGSNYNIQNAHGILEDYYKTLGSQI